MALQLFKIADVTVATPQTSVTFSSIPQGYTDLKLVISSRTNNAQVYANINIQFNNSGGTAYAYKYLQGNGSTAASSGQTGVDSIYGINTDEGANSTANTFSNWEVYVPNYTGNTNKSVSMDSVMETNATGAWVTFVAGVWSNTAAITQVTIGTAGSGASYLANSTFTLYGVL